MLFVQPVLAITGIPTSIPALTDSYEEVPTLPGKLRTIPSLTSLSPAESSSSLQQRVYELEDLVREQNKLLDFYRANKHGKTSK